MTRQLTVDPAPNRHEAVAIASAVAAVVDEERTFAPRDPTPAVYRSAWRRAGFAEGIVRVSDNGWGG